MRLEDKWTLPTDCSEWLAHELRCQIFDWNDKFRIAFSFGPLHSLRFASFAVHTTISPPSFILMEHLKLFSLDVARKIIYGLCDQLELAEISIFCTSIKMLKVLFLPSIAKCWCAHVCEGLEGWSSIDWYAIYWPEWQMRISINHLFCFRTFHKYRQQLSPTTGSSQTKHFKLFATW